MYNSNDYAEFWIEDGILFFVYRPKLLIDRKIAERIVRDRIRFQNERAYPICCDLRNLKNVEKDGRDFLAQQGSILAKAVALLVERNFSERISQIFLETSKPKVPTAVFTSKIKALEFLDRYK